MFQWIVNTLLGIVGEVGYFHLEDSDYYETDEEAGEIYFRNGDKAYTITIKEVPVR